MLYKKANTILGIPLANFLSFYFIIFFGQCAQACIYEKTIGAPFLYFLILYLYIQLLFMHIVFSHVAFEWYVIFMLSWHFFIFVRKIYCLGKFILTTFFFVPRCQIIWCHLNCVEFYIHIYIYIYFIQHVT